MITFAKCDVGAADTFSDDDDYLVCQMKYFISTKVLIRYSSIYAVRTDLPEAAIITLMEDLLFQVILYKQKERVRTENSSHGFVR